MTVKESPVVLGCAMMVLIVWTTPAMAYIDPGTGSLILQSIIGTVAGTAVALKIYWGRIRQRFFTHAPTDRAKEADQDTR